MNEQQNPDEGEPIGLDEIGDDKAADPQDDKAIELPVEDGDSIGQPG